jgi:GntR family transcriptional regulator/MocR family aminotransferase
MHPQQQRGRLPGYACVNDWLSQDAFGPLKACLAAAGMVFNPLHCAF